MMYLKDFNQYINEGARLIAPNYDKAELSWQDDKTLPLEVLKTNNTHNVTGFTKVGITKGGSFLVYYGLTVDPNRNEKLGAEDPIFKLTLDSLKKSNILNSDSALFKFTSRTANEIKSKKGNINYVVSLGSTAGLSNDLAKAFTRHFNDAKFIPLSKYDFANFEQALNWKYIRDYDVKVKEKGDRPILDKVKIDVLNAIDRDKTSPQLIRAIRKAPSADKLRGIILAGDPKNRYHQYDPSGETTIFWKKEPYNIRSSGISHGGSRAWLKTKYATPKTSGEFGETAFVEAVKKCIIGGATMLFVDDNSRTKEDISKIFDAIIELAENIIADIDTVDSKLISQYHKRFLAYVLIYLPEPRSQGDSSDITVKKLASEEDVNGFINGGLASIQSWIRQNNSTESKDAESSSKETEKIYSPSSYIVTERDRLMASVFSMATNQFYIFMKTRRQTAAKDNFRKAWETLIVLPEFKIFTENKLADVFIKMAKQKNWFKTNGLISAEEITNIIKSK